MKELLDVLIAIHVDYTGQEYHHIFFTLLHHGGDWFNSPLLSRVKNPTISVMCLYSVCYNIKCY